MAKSYPKRHGATSVEEYREAGYLPDALLNYLALLGWAPDGQTTIVSRQDLCREFSLDHVSKNPATFDYKKLDWIQQHYLQSMSDDEFSQKVLVPQLVAARLERGPAEAAYTRRPDWFNLLSSVLKPRTTLLPEVVEKAHFLYEGDEVSLDAKSVEKKKPCQARCP
jgi:glutamyl-tRNA synthetase